MFDITFVFIVRVLSKLSYFIKLLTTNSAFEFSIFFWMSLYVCIFTRQSVEGNQTFLTLECTFMDYLMVL